MKIAVIIHGNLRTFLMQTREGVGRVCDLFMKNIVNSNNADVFAFTDTNDFYYNGTQFFPSTRKIEILGNDSFRIYDKVDFIETNDAKDIIKNQISGIIGSSLKKLEIESPFDVNIDPKLKPLTDLNLTGCSPTLLIQQYRKIKLVYNFLQEFEKENNVKYDIIIRWRFDLFAQRLLDIRKYDLINKDIYVPGGNPPILYDWYAFGTREVMNKCLNIYDNLGFTINYGNTEYVMSSEYHLFKTLEINNFRRGFACGFGDVYRYQDPRNRTNAHELLSGKITNATLINYTSGNETGIENY